MLRFIVRRLIVTVPMVLVVVSLTWGLIRLAPGNFYTGEKPIPPAIEKNLREEVRASTGRGTCSTERCCPIRCAAISDRR